MPAGSRRSIRLLFLLAATGSSRLNPRHAVVVESLSVGEQAPATTTTTRAAHRRRCFSAPLFRRPTRPRCRPGTRTPLAAGTRPVDFAAVDCSALEVTERDREDVIAELGYLPPNFLRISGRTDGGRPVAIKTYPLNGGARRRRAKARGELTPFPTLYWLCNADISRAVADMERRGYVKILEERIRSDERHIERFRTCHVEYALDRWGTLTEEDRILLESGGDDRGGGGELEEGLGGREGRRRINERMVHMIRRSGVAGTDYLGGTDADEASESSFVPSVKCLHAHYAHYRSGGNANIVGRWTHNVLREEYPYVDL